MKRLIASVLAVIFGLLMVFSPVYAGNGKVVVCHATSSDTNPFVRIEVSVNSIASAADWFNGHGGHPGDAWEGFTAKNGDVISPQGDVDVCKDSPEPTPTSIPPTETPVPPTETPVPTNTPEPTPTSIGPTPTLVNPTKTPTPFVIPPRPTKTPAPKPTGGETGSFFPVIGFGLIGLGFLLFPWKKVLN